MPSTLSLLGLALPSAHAITSGSDQRRPLPISTCSRNITDLNWSNSIPAWRSGIPSGTPYCISRWDHGAKIVGLAAFKETDSSIGCEGRGGINRLEVTFDDGVMVAIGGQSTDCQAGSFSLDYDELFSDVFSNVAGSNPDGQGKMGWAHHTQREKDKILWNYLKDEYNPGATQQSYTTGGGLLIGLVGYQQDDLLETVVPTFSPADIDHVTRDNVFYTTKNLEDMAINNEVLAVGSWVNAGEKPIGYTFSGNTTMSSTYITQWPHSMTAGEKYDIKLISGWRIPRLLAGQTGTGSRWELSYESGGESGQVDRQTLRWSVSGTVPPGKIVTCKASTAVANGSFTVTSDVTIYFKDGSKWTFSSVDKIHGSGIAAMGVVTTCSEMDSHSMDSSLLGVQAQDEARAPAAQTAAKVDLR